MLKRMVIFLLLSFFVLPRLAYAAAPQSDEELDASAISRAHKVIAKYKSNPDYGTDMGLHFKHGESLFEIASYMPPEKRLAYYKEGAAIVLEAVKNNPAIIVKSYIWDDELFIEGLLLAAPFEGPKRFARLVDIAREYSARKTDREVSAAWVSQVHSALLKLPEAQAAKLRGVAYKDALKLAADAQSWSSDAKAANSLLALADLSLSLKGEERKKVVALVKGNVKAARRKEEWGAWHKASYALLMVESGALGTLAPQSIFSPPAAAAAAKAAPLSPAMQKQLARAARALFVHAFIRMNERDLGKYSKNLYCLYEQLRGVYQEDALLLAQYSLFAYLASELPHQNRQRDKERSEQLKELHSKYALRALELAPGNPYVLAVLAFANEKSGVISGDKKSLPLHTKAVCLGGDTPELWLLWGDDFERSVTSFEEALASPQALAGHAGQCPVFANYLEARLITRSAKLKANKQASVFTDKMMQYSLIGQATILQKMLSGDYAPLVSAGIIPPSLLQREMSIHDEESMDMMLGIPLLEAALREKPGPVAGAYVSSLLAQLDLRAWDFNGRADAARLRRALEQARKALQEQSQWAETASWTIRGNIFKKSLEAFAESMSNIIMYDPDYSVSPEALVAYFDELMRLSGQTVFDDNFFTRWSHFRFSRDAARKAEINTAKNEALLTLAERMPLPDFAQEELDKSWDEAVESGVAKRLERDKKKKDWSGRYFTRNMMQRRLYIIRYAYTVDEEDKALLREHFALGESYAGGNKAGLAYWLNLLEKDLEERILTQVKSEMLRAEVDRLKVLLKHFK